MFGTADFLKQFKDFCIQTFDDREFNEKKDPSLITVGPPRNYDLNKLQKLNSAGAGIFFTVNQFPGGKRSKELCAGVNAWFSECDTLSIEQQMDMLLKCPLIPSMIVRSKKSLHAYWMAKDGTEKNFVRIQQGLIKYFQGDPAMKDISRVLRIPGYYHNKTAEPFMVEIIHVAEGLAYTEKEMMEAFPWEAPVDSVQSTVNSKPFSNAGADITFWDAISRVSNKEALTRMSGSAIVNSDILSFRKRATGGEYIDVNGKPADAWLDGNGAIGSGKGGGPTWIQWLGFYGWNKSDIAKWAKDNLADLIPTHLVEDRRAVTFSRYQPPLKKTENAVGNFKIDVTTAKDHVKSVTDSFLTPPSPFTWGTTELDKIMPAVEEGHYAIIFGQQGSGKTTFAFNMAMENAKKVPNVFFLTLEMSKDQLLRRYARDRAGVTKEQYRNRNFDTTIAEQFLKDLGDLKLVGIDKGELYDVKKLEEMITTFGVKMLYIDNLNKVKGAGKNELEQTQGVSEGILNLTRQYKIPIVLIHHANKPLNERASKETTEVPKHAKFRGMSGMRGTNKTADDADIIVECARNIVEKSQAPILMADDMRQSAMTSLSVYKDREFDSRFTTNVFYYRGNFYDNWEVPKMIAHKDMINKSNQINQANIDAQKIADEFGGEVVN